MMIWISVALLGLTLLGGALMGALCLMEKDLSKVLIYGHGAGAVVGLVLLVVAFVVGANAWLALSLAVLIVAGLVGFILFSYEVRGKFFPMSLMYVHGAIALVGFVILLLGALGLFGGTTP